MATIFEDDFNSYNDGDLNGQGDWAGATEFDVQSAMVKEGAKAVEVSGVNKSIIKSGNSLTEGKIVVYMRQKEIGGITRFNLLEGANRVIIVKMESSFVYHNGASYTSFGSWVADTWYCVQIEWRSVDKKVRYRIDEGDWTNWVIPWVEYTDGIDGVRLEGKSTKIGYFDYIAEEPYVAPSVDTGNFFNLF